ncbi:MAG: N-acetyltransferase [Firmicutes bacterium]|jgi:GNAT superfamily N-acetyltransferase|nr:N-acetyltransferase [Bacillota bacterium]
MSGIVVDMVATRAERLSFVKLPWAIYRGDPNWVPPLISDMLRTMDPRHNVLLRMGPYAHFLARKGGRVVGRVGVGMDGNLNREKRRSEGYFTLFESVNDFDITRSLFDVALSWLRQHGATRVTGPQSPSNGDDYRALLIDGFDEPPFLMMSYNPPYYPELLSEYGFEKQFDRLAYKYDMTQGIPERFQRLVGRAMERFGFRIDPVNTRNIEGELRDIKEIVDRSMPEEWPDMVPPTMEELRAQASQILPVADPELILIARAGDRPVGLVIALPDYNQVLKHLNGRLFPFGFLKFMWLRRRITAARVFVLMVVPEFHKKGVSAAMYLHLFRRAKERGYTLGEGSTVHEFNIPMRRDAEGVGGVQYKTYRIYQKEL